MLEGCTVSFLLIKNKMVHFCQRTKPGISVRHLVMWFFLNLYVKNKVPFSLDSQILNGMRSRVQLLHLMPCTIPCSYWSQIDGYVTRLACTLWVVRAFVGAAGYLNHTDTSDTWFWPCLFPSLGSWSPRLSSVCSQSRSLPVVSTGLAPSSSSVPFSFSAWVCLFLPI